MHIDRCTVKELLVIVMCAHYRHDAVASVQNVVAWPTVGVVPM
jgi:hypothetical protein